MEGVTKTLMLRAGMATAVAVACLLLYRGGSEEAKPPSVESASSAVTATSTLAPSPSQHESGTYFSAVEKNSVVLTEEPLTAAQRAVLEQLRESTPEVFALGKEERALIEGHSQVDSRSETLLPATRKVGEEEEAELIERLRAEPHPAGDFTMDENGLKLIPNNEGEKLEK